MVEEMSKGGGSRLASVSEVVVGDLPIPRVPVQSKFEIAIPDGGPDIGGDFGCRHMVVIAIVRRPDFEPAALPYRSWRLEPAMPSPVLRPKARPQRLVDGGDRRNDIVRPANLAERKLNACACRLLGFEKDESMLMGQDHCCASRESARGSSARREQAAAAVKRALWRLLATLRARALPIGRNPL